MKKIAVFGAAFDPPTKGHEDAILQCLEVFDEVYLVPAYSHAFDKKMSEHRFRTSMVELFVTDLEDPRVKMIDCEPDLKTAPDLPVYSIDVLSHLQKLAPDNQFSLVIGPDNFNQFDKFYQNETLKEQFSPFVVKERRDIRSTKVREGLKNNHDVRTMVTPQVYRYILDRKLYS